MRSGTIFLIILVFIFIITISDMASAKEIIVDDDYGADFISIQEAVNNSVTGDIIIVRPGTYTENVLVDVTGITIRSESNDGYVRVKPLNDSTDTLLITADNITVSGLNITGASKDSYKNAIFITKGAQRVTNTPSFRVGMK